MEVKAINNVYQQPAFSGSKKEKKAGSMGYEQVKIDNPISKKASNGMKTLLYAAMAAGALSTAASCSKDDWIGSSSSSSANATANVWFTPVCPETVHDTVHLTKHDTITLRDTIKLAGDTVKLPGDTIILPGDTVYRTDTIHHRDTVNNRDTLYVCASS